MLQTHSLQNLNSDRITVQLYRKPSQLSITFRTLLAVQILSGYHTVVTLRNVALNSDLSIRGF